MGQSVSLPIREVRPFDQLSVKLSDQGYAPLPTNRSTQRSGIANVFNNDNVFVDKRSLKLCGKHSRLNKRSTRVSKIPVAVWRSNLFPGSASSVAKYKQTGEHIGANTECSAINCGFADRSLKCPNGGSKAAPMPFSNMEEDGGCVPRKGISYTVAVGKENSRVKPTIVQPPRSTKKAIFNQAERLRAAEINRQEYLDAKVRVARIYDIKKHELTQRRLAMSAEQRHKFNRNEQYRENNPCRETISERLEILRANPVTTRLCKSDPEHK